METMMLDSKTGVGSVASNERGSGARFNGDKPDFSLIPLVTMEDEARVWMHGRAKYAAWNWAKGMPWSVPLGCMLRHLAAFQRGEDIDPESGLPHMAHVMCNARMLTLYAKTYPEGDDRPKEWLTPPVQPEQAVSSVYADSVNREYATPWGIVVTTGDPADWEHA